MRLTRVKVLRSLSRFDTATVEDVAVVLNSERGPVRAHLRESVLAGHVVTMGKNHIRYSLAEPGKAWLRQA